MKWVMGDHRWMGGDYRRIRRRLGYHREKGRE